MKFTLARSIVILAFVSSATAQIDLYQGVSNEDLDTTSTSHPESASDSDRAAALESMIRTTTTADLTQRPYMFGDYVRTRSTSTLSSATSTSATPRASLTGSGLLAEYGTCYEMQFWRNGSLSCPDLYGAHFGPQSRCVLESGRTMCCVKPQDCPTYNNKTAQAFSTAVRNSNTTTLHTSIAPYTTLSPVNSSHIVLPYTTLSLVSSSHTVSLTTIQTAVPATFSELVGSCGFAVMQAGLPRCPQGFSTSGTMCTLPNGHVMCCKYKSDCPVKSPEAVTLSSATSTSSSAAATTTCTAED